MPYVIKVRWLLNLTSHLFLEGTKLYSSCKGLNRMELKSLSLKNSRRSCKGTSPFEESASLYESLDINNAQFFAFDISLDQLKGIAGGYDDKQGMRNQ